MEQAELVSAMTSLLLFAVHTHYDMSPISIDTLDNRLIGNSINAADLH